MNKTLNHILLPIAVLLMLVGLAVISKQQSELDIQNMPSLPKPIAKEMALITSAGQSIDTYIVKDIANKLMIHNISCLRRRPWSLTTSNPLYL